MDTLFQRAWWITWVMLFALLGSMLVALQKQRYEAPAIVPRGIHHVFDLRGEEILEVPYKSIHKLGSGNIRVTLDLFADQTWNTKDATYIFRPILDHEKTPDMDLGKVNLSCLLYKDMWRCMSEHHDMVTVYDLYKDGKWIQSHTLKKEEVFEFKHGTAEIILARSSPIHASNAMAYNVRESTAVRVWVDPDIEQKTRGTLIKDWGKEAFVQNQTLWQWSLSILLICLLAIPAWSLVRKEKAPEAIRWGLFFIGLCILILVMFYSRKRFNIP